MSRTGVIFAILFATAFSASADPKEKDAAAILQELDAIALQAAEHAVALVEFDQKHPKLEEETIGYRVQAQTLKQKRQTILRDLNQSFEEAYRCILKHSREFDPPEPFGLHPIVTTFGPSLFGVTSSLSIKLGAYLLGIPLVEEAFLLPTLAGASHMAIFILVVDSDRFPIHDAMRYLRKRFEKTLIAALKKNEAVRKEISFLRSGRYLDDLRKEASSVCEAQIKVRVAAQVDDETTEDESNSSVKRAQLQRATSQ